MYELLNRIKETGDIKKIPEDRLDELAEEIRGFLIEKVSHTGGHLASNLGVVELTMALHLFLDLPSDKLIFDVGHQSYVHKILTGRKDKFDTLRKLNGLSGFPNRSESPCDICNVGHSSTSISLAVGLVNARIIKGGKEKVVAVIGDGALTGGLALEGLNNAGKLKSNLIIVLNDNNMSISESVGAMSGYLAKMRTSVGYNNFKGGIEETLGKVPWGKSVVSKLKRSKDSIKHLVVPGMFFEDMGLTYIGPVDGHNIESVRSALEAASRKNNAVLLHVITKKGKGYKIAEHEPAKYHGVNAFDINTGKNVLGRADHAKTYSEVFSDEIVKIAENDRNIVAITAAMPDGCGLNNFKKRFPSRYFDVGIAEEHAVSFAAGLAIADLTPVFVVYSTFLQRAYDEMLHDVCLNNLHVVLMVDRAGLVGRDGPTHQGVFDLSYFTQMPNMKLFAPKDERDMRKMMRYAIYCKGPVAIRYPRGNASNYFDDLDDTPVAAGKGVWVRKNEKRDAVILAVGSMVETAVKAGEILLKKGIKIDVADMRSVKPFDEEIALEGASAPLVVTMEENVLSGGFGEHIDSFYENRGIKTGVLNIAFPDKFIEHGEVGELLKIYEMDAASVADRIEKRIKQEN